MSEVFTKIYFILPLSSGGEGGVGGHFENLAFMKYFPLRQQWVLLVIALFLLGSLYFSFVYHPSPSSKEFVKEVAVEVSGEVQSPAVYLFQNQPTLREAVERAGGLKEAALFDTPSSSEILETGTRLIVTKQSSQVPSSLFPIVATRNRGEKEEGLHAGMKRDEIKIRIGSMAANKLLVFSIPLDLNRVSAEDLCLISGIGESLAQEIIAYRDRRKGFRSVEDLRNVRGIGEKKYQSLKGFFTAR